MFELLLNNLRGMKRKKFRTMLTVFGIAVGVMAIVVIAMIGEVGKRSLNSELDSMGIGGLYLNAGDTSHALFSPAELQEMKNEKNVAGATPFTTKIMTAQCHGTSSQVLTWGIDDQAPSIVSLDLLHGRQLNAQDVSANSPVCVVDESFAELFFHRQNIVGKTFSLNYGGKNALLTVVGVVSSGGNLLKGLMGDVVPTFLYLPYTTMSRFSGNVKFSQMVLKLQKGADENLVIGNIKTSLSSDENLGKTLKIQNLNGQKDKLNGILNIVTVVLAAVGGISLLVAGLSIMTVMLNTVHERTREIGIKKSIGASRHLILLEFLNEAFLISLLGGILGDLIGLLLGFFGCLFFHVPFFFPWKILALCLLFAVASGLLFGFYPARKAACLKPVDALRWE